MLLRSLRHLRDFSQLWRHRIEKEIVEARNSVKKLGRVLFACETDAKQAADRWQKENLHFILRILEIGMSSKRNGGKRGRPKKGEVLEQGYLIKAEVDRNEEIIAKERARLGKFVLASNDTHLDGELMLRHYKGQNAVERGFRVLKDKSFRVAEVYLKKGARWSGWMRAFRAAGFQEVRQDRPA